MRELSLGTAFCRFCRFSIYNSVRFVYISVTLLFTLFFLFLLAKIYAMPFLPCHLRHEWQIIDFKQFFLAKTLAKTCHVDSIDGKSLILKGFLFDKRVMSLKNKALAQIIITMLLYKTRAKTF